MLDTHLDAMVKENSLAHAVKEISEMQKSFQKCMLESHLAYLKSIEASLERLGAKIELAAEPVVKDTLRQGASANFVGPETEVYLDEPMEFVVTETPSLEKKSLWMPNQLI